MNKLLLRIDPLKYLYKNKKGGENLAALFTINNF